MKGLLLRAAVLVSNVSRVRTPGLIAVAVLAGEGGEKSVFLFLFYLSRLVPNRPLPLK